MELGIFAKTFQRPTLEEVCEAVTHCGLGSVQFNFSCAGLPSLPETIEPSTVAWIARSLTDRGLRMAAVSGTFNMIHPDQARRVEGLRRLAGLVKICRDLGTRIITLCSGTRDAENMWAGHPDNRGAAAWRDLVAGLEQVLPRAEAADVVLAVEPEHANVVDSAARARRLIDELGSPALRVVIDAANLLTPQSAVPQQAVLCEAMEQVGTQVVLAHAKDVDAAGTVRAAGQGLVDWECYVELLKQVGFDGGLIMHGMEEREAAQAAKFLRDLLRRSPESRAHPRPTGN